MNQHAPTPEDRLQIAVASRLRRLQGMSVDTSRLDVSMRHALTADSAPARRLTWLRPVRIAAGLLLLIGVLAVVLINVNGRVAMASPTELAQVHRMMAAGDGHAIPVDSLQEAERLLAERWGRAPGLPQVPEMDVMSCCLHQLGEHQVAAVGLQVDGVPLTLAASGPGDPQLMKGRRTTVSGTVFHLQSAENVNMVATERNGRWICLMGQLPFGRLIELATELRW
jgi:hypothetical protein